MVPSAAAEGHQHADQGRKAEDGRPNSQVKEYKLDNELAFRAANRRSRTTRVIVELQPGAALPRSLAAYAKPNGELGIINGHVIDLPNRLLNHMAAHPSVFRIHYDRPAARFNYRTSLTVGTKAVRDTLGLTGAGVGVAVIDSGIVTYHEDLTSNSSTTYPYGNQRVSKFVDFVNGQTAPYDDNGHGSHVAGIIAGNGFDSNGRKAGAAPGASLVSLKVLDANGNGTVSSIIAALDWVLENHTTYNIRVVNMSVGAAIHESAWTDPLTLAAKRVVDAGVVVVGAAGNFGRNSAGLPQYGGISAPGNAPWVLTVGGSSTNGTAKRGDDVMGSYSSRGPSYIDWNAKPDLVAPGTGTVSLSSSGSEFALTRQTALFPGSFPTGTLPYLSLSGTSMAAPVVAGTVALMLEANPNLTPNGVKAILQYTAQQYPGYNGLTQGAGFLNTVGALRLARFYATATPGARVPVQKMWSKHIIWGNHRLGSGMLNPNANAFRVGTNWGVAKTAAGDNIVWGTACGSADCDNIVWGTAADGDNIVWGTAADGDNIVWGTAAAAGDNIVWGTANEDNTVWATDAGDNIVWGTAADGDNIVWGTADGDNIVWGTADGDNIVWGTVSANGDNIVWGTADGDNIVWGTASDVNNAWLLSPDGTQTRLTGMQVFDKLKDRTLLELLEYTPGAASLATALPPAPIVPEVPLVLLPELLAPALPIEPLVPVVMVAPIAELVPAPVAPPQTSVQPLGGL